MSSALALASAKKAVQASQIVGDAIPGRCRSMCWWWPETDRETPGEIVFSGFPHLIDGVHVIGDGRHQRLTKMIREATTLPRPARSLASVDVPATNPGNAGSLSWLVWTLGLRFRFHF
jgi:hypothetical protein